MRVRGPWDRWDQWKRKRESAAQYELAIRVYSDAQKKVDSICGEGAAVAIVCLIAAWQRVGETHAAQK
jgi:hypothetical protein